MTHNDTLGFRLTSRYRPHLNDNGKVQLAVFSKLRNLGSIISCADFRGFVISRDISIPRCTLPEPEPVDRINPSITATTIGESNGIHAYTSSRGSISIPPSSTYRTPEYTTTVSLTTGIVAQSFSIASSSQYHVSHESSKGSMLMSMTPSLSSPSLSSGTYHSVSSSKSSLSSPSLPSGTDRSVSSSKSKIILKTQMSIHVNISNTNIPKLSTQLFTDVFSTSATNTPANPVDEADNANNDPNILAWCVYLVGSFITIISLCSGKSELVREESDKKEKTLTILCYRFDSPTKQVRRFLFVYM